jgi:hypothetical protein
MMDKDQAKRAMCVELWRYVTIGEAVEALLDNDTAKLDKIRALKGRLDAANAKMQADVDTADAASLETLICTFKYPVDSVK